MSARLASFAVFLLLFGIGLGGTLAGKEGLPQFLLCVVGCVGTCVSLALIYDKENG